MSYRGHSGHNSDENTTVRRYRADSKIIIYKKSIIYFCLQTPEMYLKQDNI